jgi:PAS domain S-box-containing protein
MVRLRLKPPRVLTGANLGSTWPDQQLEEKLRDSDVRFDTIFHSSRDSIVLADAQSKILQINKTTERLFGYKQDLIGQPFSLLLPERYRKTHDELIQKLLSGKERSVDRPLELHGVRKDSSEFPLELTLSLWMNQDQPCYAAIIRETTVRKEAEQSLQQKVEMIELLQNVTVACNRASNPEEALQFALDQICGHTPWTFGHIYFVPTAASDTLIPSRLWCSSHAESAEHLRNVTESVPLKRGAGLPGLVLETQKPAWVRTVQADPRFKRQNAQHAGLSFPVMMGSAVVAIMEFFSDIPNEPDQQFLDVMSSVGTQLGRVFERQRAMDELRRSREKLRALSAHLEFIREQERVKIAREIHDDLGQVLGALKMNLSLLQQNLMESSVTVPRREILKEMGDMCKLADQTIHSVRRIITELRPEVLDHLDFKAAVEWQVQEFQKRAKIRCDFQSNVQNIDLNRDTSTALFRILQETLTNIMRHATATRAKIELKQLPESISLTVKDNGRGITEEEIAKAGSFGILGIKERVLFLGGEVEIKGAPGEGTTIKVTVPTAETPPSVFQLKL